jgi:hypothetical protein
MGRTQHRARDRCAAVAIMMFIITACGATEPSAPDSSSDVELRPNWHEDVAPIVHERCVGCHDDDAATFALATYDSAAPWATLMAEAVSSQAMPPWGAQETEACQPRHGWANDRRLSAAERDLITTWAALGAPEGDPEHAAVLPSPPDLALADPSDIFEIPAPISIADDVDSFSCVSIDPGIDEDVWITGIELLPDNEQVVHHVLIMLDVSGASAALADPEDGTYPCEALHLGTMLGSYFPGSVATEMPADVGVPFPMGARIVLNFHYHPTDLGGDVDQSQVAVRWTSDAPSHSALISTFGNATTAAGGLLPGPNDPPGEPVFMVPAGASAHTETMQLAVPLGLPDNTRLFLLGPHMHRVGTQIRLTHERDGETQCLIEDPRWDPDWQSIYMVDGGIADFPIFMPGDMLSIQCTYDNSLDNPEVVETLAGFGLDSPITVSMGSAALDEMCMFVFGLAIPN